jgi:type I restriction enzyme, S subunit
MMEEQTINGLPKTWKWVKLGKVVKTIDGDRGKNYPTKNDFVPHGFCLFLSTKNVRQDRFVFEENIFITKEKDEVLRGGKLQLNDVIITTRGTLGNVAIYNDKVPFKHVRINSGMLLLRTIDEELDNHFLMKFITSPIFINQLKNKQTGTAQPQIPANILREIIIPIPSITEQKQIVSKIEELLTELDKGIEEIKIAQQHLKVYRQAVLKWAFEGKLTNEDVKNGELPDGWKRVKIEDIANIGTGATPLKSKKEYYENGTIAWVTSGALNEEYVNEATDYVTEKALKETNLSVYPKHTLLLAMYGEGKTRGKCSELLIDACTNQAIAAISFEKHDVRVKPFLKYYLLKNYNDIRMLSSGGVQPNLNLGIVKKTNIPFPPFEEQQQIVQEIESRLSVCDKIEETITNSLKQAEALRQSILKKAFKGELV